MFNEDGETDMKLIVAFLTFENVPKENLEEKLPGLTSWLPDVMLGTETICCENRRLPNIAHAGHAYSTQRCDQLKKTNCSVF